MTKALSFQGGVAENRFVFVLAAVSRCVQDPFPAPGGASGAVPGRGRSDAGRAPGSPSAGD